MARAEVCLLSNIHYWDNYVTVGPAISNIHDWDSDVTVVPAISNIHYWDSYVTVVPAINQVSCLLGSTYLPPP